MSGTLIFIIGIILNIIAAVLWLRYIYKGEGKITLGWLVLAILVSLVPYTTAVLGVIFYVTINSDKVIIGKK